MGVMVQRLARLTPHSKILFLFFGVPPEEEDLEEEEEEDRSESFATSEVLHVVWV